MIKAGGPMYEQSKREQLRERRQTAAFRRKQARESKEAAAVYRNISQFAFYVMVIAALLALNVYLELHTIRNYPTLRDFVCRDGTSLGFLFCHYFDYCPRPNLFHP